MRNLFDFFFFAVVLVFDFEFKFIVIPFLNLFLSCRIALANRVLTRWKTLSGYPQVGGGLASHLLKTTTASNSRTNRITVSDQSV